VWVRESSFGRHLDGPIPRRLSLTVLASDLRLGFPQLQEFLKAGTAAPKS